MKSKEGLKNTGIFPTVTCPEAAFGPVNERAESQRRQWALLKAESKHCCLSPNYGTCGNFHLFLMIRARLTEQAMIFISAPVTINGTKKKTSKFVNS
ncbi:MAG TPA: hypothetical protein VJ969_06825 [Desulfopila sp.]|nr:hypothetical protein [Desulfopila sp.]